MREKWLYISFPPRSGPFANEEGILVDCLRPLGLRSVAVLQCAVLPPQLHGTLHRAGHHALTAITTGESPQGNRDD